MDLRIGKRYLAALPLEGEVVVTLLSPTTGTSFPEGGGEALYVAAWGSEPKTGAGSPVTGAQRFLRGDYLKTPVWPSE